MRLHAYRNARPSSRHLQRHLLPPVLYKIDCVGRCWGLRSPVAPIENLRRRIWYPTEMHGLMHAWRLRLGRWLFTRVLRLAVKVPARCEMDLRARPAESPFLRQARTERSAVG
jgi:hypothetical protein